MHFKKIPLAGKRRRNGDTEKKKGREGTASYSCCRFLCLLLLDCQILILRLGSSFGVTFSGWAPSRAIGNRTWAAARGKSNTSFFRLKMVMRCLSLSHIATARIIFYYYRDAVFFRGKEGTSLCSRPTTKMDDATENFRIFFVCVCCTPHYAFSPQKSGMSDKNCCLISYDFILGLESAQSLGGGGRKKADKTFFSGEQSGKWFFDT